MPPRYRSCLRILVSDYQRLYQSLKGLVRAAWRASLLLPEVSPLTGVAGNGSTSTSAGSCQMSLIPAKASGLKLSSWIFDERIEKALYLCPRQGSMLQALAPAPRGPPRIKSKDGSATQWRQLATSLVRNLPADCRLGSRPFVGISAIITGGGRVRIPYTCQINLGTLP